MKSVAFLLASLGVAGASASGPIPSHSPAPTPFTADLNIKLCDEQGCKPSPKRVALDATSGGTQHLISVGGAGVDELTLKYGGSDIGGPRVYLIEDEGTNKNTMFMLRGQEFTFDVELSTMPCGFNAALYFVGMTANEGGAEDGTNYCDAQAVGGTFCSEMDLFEGNTVAQQYTTHGCSDACASFTEGVAECELTDSPKTVCDQSGCGMNPFRYGPGTTYDDEFNNEAWHGFGPDFDIDTSKPFTVTTQFQDASITRFYQQNGKRVNLPTLYVFPPSDGSHYEPFESPEIREDFCADIYDRWDGGAGYKPLEQMFKNMENGMVLAMSAWYAQETYVDGKPAGEQTGMSWLDGVNNWGHYTKAGPCHETTSDAGEHEATFSNIRFGAIGTTTGPTPSPAPSPAPTPTPPPPPSPVPPPSPTPSPSAGCCSWDGKYCGDTTEYCAGNEQQCKQCDGEWCTDCLPPFTTTVAPAPAPSPTPSPTPSDCPGGSLNACIDLCPADVFTECVESCQRRCASTVSV